MVGQRFWGLPLFITAPVGCLLLVSFASFNSIAAERETSARCRTKPSRPKSAQELGGRNETVHHAFRFRTVRT